MLEFLADKVFFVFLEGMCFQEKKSIIKWGQIVFPPFLYSNEADILYIYCFGRETSRGQLN